jgi:signal recognition particle GTPase
LRTGSREIAPHDRPFNIDSMTPAERRDPGLIDLSRRHRIAAGSAAEPAAVSISIQYFDRMADLIRSWR